MTQKVFSIKRYNDMVEETFEKVRELAALKGAEYSGDEDRLDNFRRNAVKWGLASMEQCWGVYVGKHIDAVEQYIRDLAVGKDRKRLETLEGRVDDIITYMLLFKAMLREREDEIKVGRDFGESKAFTGTTMPHVKDE